MLWLVLFSILVYSCFRYYYSNNKNLIPYGILERTEVFDVAQNRYHLEQYAFKDSIDSYRYYRKVVSDLAKKTDLKMTQYDLYDWSYTYFFFDNYSFKINRFGNKLQCIKSEECVTFTTFEKDFSEILKRIH